MACESCEISSCYELGDNETVICAEDRMLCEPCACRRIRRYLTMGDIDNVQIMQCSQELCNVSCGDGFIEDNVMYLCNRNCCTPVGDQEITCERGLLIITNLLLVSMYIIICDALLCTYMILSK